MNSDLAFIAGNNGQIQVVDLATLSLVETLQVEGSTDNISALALADGWLYVAEGGRFTSADGAHRLMRINVDPSSAGFLAQQQQITFSSPIDAPNGYFDLALSAGRYLGVTASAQPINLQGGTSAAGNVFVIDLESLPPADSTADVLPPAVANAVLVSSSDFGSDRGKGPQYIAASSTPGQFILTSALDHNDGLETVSFGINAKDGTLDGTSQVGDTSLELKPDGDAWLQAFYQQDVQRASGVVTVVVDGVTYALVGDYNLPQNDPHFSSDTLDQVQIGGKIGIVRDPFGQAQYLGATTPQVGAWIDHLALSADSSTLYASVSTWNYQNGISPQTGLLVFDVKTLVEAALQNPNITKPIDISDPAAQPVNLALGNIFGIAVPPVDPPATVANPIRYG